MTHHDHPLCDQNRRCHPAAATAPITTDRRGLLRATAAAGLAAWLARPLTVLANDLPFLDRIGLQLYTVRDQMKADANATLDAIAAAGYRQVELMAIDDQAVEIASMARDKGMMVHSAFMDWRAIASPAQSNVAAQPDVSAQPDQADVTSVDRTIELAERMGLRHVVFGYIGQPYRQSESQCQQIAETANAAAEKTRLAGMRMCYHNHSFEFGKFADSDKTPFDVFIERFDPQVMDFELDVFWVKIGGRDPIEMMKRLAGRITQVHLKDLKDGVGTITDEGQVPADAFQELGGGVIDIPAVLQLAKQIGVRECHVEQDQSPAPLESIARSFQFLQGKKS